MMSRINDGILSPTSPRDNRDLLFRDRTLVYRGQEASALEIAAEQMRIASSISAEKQRELIASEESTLYSQAIHYANRMVNLLVPLDIGASKTHRNQDHVYDDERASNSITNRFVFMYYHCFLLFPSQYFFSTAIKFY